MCFGTSGMFEQDDVENWTSITNMAKGHLGGAGGAEQHHGHGARRWHRRLATGAVVGPGSAVVGYGEYNQRAFLQRWGRYLGDGASARQATLSWRPRPAVEAAG